MLLVEVVVEGPERPPPGAPLRVEVRDTALADTEAPLVSEQRAAVSGERSGWLQNVELDVPEEGHLTVFAHVDVDGDGAISAGDFITTRAYSVPFEEGRVQVAVQRI